jgi:hypothetical protein
MANEQPPDQQAWPRFKVTLHRRLRDSYSGMPEPNPFLTPLPEPGTKTHRMLLREWTFSAKDEAECRRLLAWAQEHNIENVRGCTLRSIERLP